MVKFKLELFCASQKRYVLNDEKCQKYVSKPQTQADSSKKSWQAKK